MSLTQSGGLPAWILRDISISLDELHPQTEWTLLRHVAAKRLGIPREAVSSLSVVKESLDARRKDAMAIVYTLCVETAAKPSARSGAQPVPAPVVQVAPVEPTGMRRRAGMPADSLRPVVVGAGPCGLFCALALAEAGLPPILVERGQPVERRREDVRAYWQGGALDAESNVQFGEGGAGTFSDGKLTTRIHDPRCTRVLDVLADLGAPEEIRWRVKPHVGTDLLVPLMVRLRERLLALGTEIRFGTRVDGLVVGNGCVRGVRLKDGEEIDASAVVLAIGHSARDTFAWLHGMGIAMEPKPFSVGVRIEHLQAQVNRAQFGGRVHYKLGAAEYGLSERFGDRAAYTFCMCPGGTVVAAASEPGTIVTNGMSDRARDGVNANSAFVVSVDPADYGRHPLEGIAFQRHLERAAFQLGGGRDAAPVQRLGDFLSGAPTTAFGAVKPTYTGDVRMARLDEALPSFVSARLRDAVAPFDRRLRGFADPDAVMTGFETRTSSPIRLTRGESLEAAGLPGLYPAGEGAGHAGGIMSAAVDGLRVAEALLDATRATER